MKFFFKQIRNGYWNLSYLQQQWSYSNDFLHRWLITELYYWISWYWTVLTQLKINLEVFLHFLHFETIYLNWDSKVSKSSVEFPCEDIWALCVYMCVCVCVCMCRSFLIKFSFFFHGKLTLISISNGVNFSKKFPQEIVHFIYVSMLLNKGVLSSLSWLHFGFLCICNLFLILCTFPYFFLSGLYNSFY